MYLRGEGLQLYLKGEGPQLYLRGEVETERAESSLIFKYVVF
jgi:hypothetical protein